MSSYLLLIILTTSVILIGALSLYFKNFIERFRYPITIISSAMVCGLIFIHIFPEIFEIGGHKIGLALLGGLFLQMILENLTSGFEHGHLHNHRKKTKGLVIGLMIGLCLHAFIEGAPLLIDPNAKQSEIVASNIHLHDNEHDHKHEDEHDHNHENEQNNDHSDVYEHSEHLEFDSTVEEVEHVHSESCDHDHSKQTENIETTSHPETMKGIVKKEITLVDKYFWAIINHNIPITIVLSALFISFGYSFRKSLNLIGIFAIAGPLGAFFGLWLLNIEGFIFFSAYLMAISTGMLLHIITHILTEHAHDRKKLSILQQIASLSIGIILVILIFGI